MTSACGTDWDISPEGGGGILKFPYTENIPEDNKSKATSSLFLVKMNVIIFQLLWRCAAVPAH